MKVKYIKVEFEREPIDGEPDIAPVAEFYDRKWNIEGPVYPRMLSMLYDIYQAIKERKG